METINEQMLGDFYNSDNIGNQFIKQSIYCCPMCGKVIKHPVISTDSSNLNCYHNNIIYIMNYVGTN